MKTKLFTLAFLVSFISFSQVQPINPGLYRTNPDKPNVKMETKVNTRVNATTTTNFNKENELVLSEEKTNVKTPLTADLSNYTDILLVNISLKDDDYSKWYDTDMYNHLPHINSKAYIPVKDILSLSVFKIQNPIEINRKKFKKDRYFLKSIKKDSYLYLILKQTKGRGDDVNSSIIVRDYKNKIIYNATHINTGLNEILAPLIDF
ncbi:MAG: hypothetical protein ABGW67_06620 [Flavobacteriaceae bacterium]|jgi:hypothetical protein